MTHPLQKISSEAELIRQILAAFLLVRGILLGVLDIHLAELQFAQHASQGMSRTEAVELMTGDAAFKAWLNDFCADMAQSLK